ncbi:hypothetical protein XnspCFBP7698_07400 [Xanthomonas sp. CFBP 7698]|nr:hypothetical protein XnspCFBP7698_07400 [Xanthomonas sp. CFBP 7698]
MVLARSPSRDLERHGCRARASRDGFTACPAMVSGRGPCSQATDHRSTTDLSELSIATRWGLGLWKAAK